MLFSLLKIPAQLALRIYCRFCKINKKALLQSEGPLLIAANHPNSFLDAIIIATLFKRPVYSLARGDAFVNNFISKILRTLNILPVYRISEGADNLQHNYTTFEDCKNIFKQNGIVLIFSEGRCVNEWHLRPLKKGTARLVLSSWQEGIPLKVIPLGINYNSFYGFGKNVDLNFGEIITKNNIDLTQSEGRQISEFNLLLQNQLQDLVIEIDTNDTDTIRKNFTVQISSLKKKLLFLPALIGKIIHWPLYYPIKQITQVKAKQSDHYDSIVVSLLFIFYPFYLLLIGWLLLLLTGSYWCSLIVCIFPFFAWSYVQLKEQF